MSAPHPPSHPDSLGAAGAPPALWRAPLLAIGLVALIAGAGAGLARLGWPVPEAAASMSSQHGALMICGFLGVVISLERAVAIGRHWAYLGPLAAGLGVIASSAGIGFAPWLFLAGSLVLLGATINIVHRQPALFTVLLALGAGCWSAGNAAWVAGSSAQELVGWWLAFPILTIAGERLDLSRFMPPSSSAKALFVSITLVLVVGMLEASTVWGRMIFGAALGSLSLWLLKYDIARRTVRNRGLTRFTAVCLLSGYAWLAVGGGVILAAGELLPGSPSYDAALHAILLGFVFSMIFGHAPIIFPAVLRVAVPYQAYFYGPLVLLHVSVLLRLAGDASGRFDWTRAGGMLNAVALAAFIAGTVAAVLRANSLAKSGPSARL